MSEHGGYFERDVGKSNLIFSEPQPGSVCATQSPE